MTVLIPTIDEIITINKIAILKDGGTFYPPSNLLNPNQLEWVLATIENPVSFGFDRYPGLFNKISLLGWHINTSHIFFDGNKRTSLASSIYMLRKNGYYLNLENSSESNQILVDICLSIANHKTCGYQRNDFTNWLESNSSKF